MGLTVPAVLLRAAPLRAVTADSVPRAIRQSSLSDDMPGAAGASLTEVMPMFRSSTRLPPPIQGKNAHLAVWFGSFRADLQCGSGSIPLGWAENTNTTDGRDEPTRLSRQTRLGNWLETFDLKA